METTSLIIRAITDQIGRHKVSLSINHKNHNFQEKKSQDMKERENVHSDTDKGDVNMGYQSDLHVMKSKSTLVLSITIFPRRQ